MRMKTKECVICAHKNGDFSRAAIAPLKVIPVHPKLFWRIHCDLMGPFPCSYSGNRYVAIAICSFSKYIEAKRNHIFLLKISGFEISQPYVTNFGQNLRVKKATKNWTSYRENTQFLTIFESEKKN